MEIETINIIVSTNASNEKEFSLTKNVIYHPTITNTSNYSEYPFFTKHVDYTTIIGYINTLPYKDLVDTFFIRSSFEKVMKLGYTPNLVTDENMNKYANINVNIMLSLLFPTTYPIKNNYENTFNTLISSGNYDQTNVYVSMQNILSFINPNQYSYIKPGGNVYSIVRCVWLNDFFNHPRYFKLMEEYKKLLKWKLAENKKLNVEIKKKIKGFIEYLKKEDVQTKLLKVNGDFITPTDSKYKMEKQLDGFKQAITTIVETIRKYKNKTKNNEQGIFDELQESLSSMVDNYDILFQVVSGSGYSREHTKYNIGNEPLRKQIELVIKLDKEIKVYSILVSLHITNKPYHPISFMYSDDRVKELIEKYSQISNFKKLLESYTDPIRQSTNYELQGEIINFQKGYENVLQDIMNPSNLLVDKRGIDTEDIVDMNRIIRYLNVGVCFSTQSESSEQKPVNEIYIKLFVIKGMLDDDNKTILDCMYKGDYLGDELYRLLNNDKSSLLLNVSNFQFDINDKRVKAKIEETQKANGNLKTTSSSNANNDENSTSKRGVVQGGRSRRRQKKRRMKKTRKLFFV